MQASLHSFFIHKQSTPIIDTSSLDSDTASIVSASSSGLSIPAQPPRQHTRAASSHGLLTFLLRRKTQASAPRHYKPAACQLLKEQHRHLQAAVQLLPAIESVRPLSGTGVAVLRVFAAVEVRTWPPPPGAAAGAQWPRACLPLPAHAAVLRPVRCTCLGCVWTLSAEMGGIAWRQRCAFEEGHVKLFAIAKRPSTPGLGEVTTCSAAVSGRTLHVCAGWSNGTTMGWTIPIHGTTPASVAASWTYAYEAQYRCNLGKWARGDNRPFTFQSWWHKPMLTWGSAAQPSTRLAATKRIGPRRSVGDASTFGLQQGLGAKRARPAAARLAGPTPRSGAAITRLAKSSSALKAKLAGLAPPSSKRAVPPSLAAVAASVLPRASAPLPAPPADAAAGSQEIAHVLRQAMAQLNSCVAPAIPPHSGRRAGAGLCLVQCCFALPYALLWFSNAWFVALDLRVRTQSMTFAESPKPVEHASVMQCFTSPSAVCVQPDGRAAGAAPQLQAREPCAWSGRIGDTSNMVPAVVAQHGVLCISTTGLAIALRWRPAPLPRTGPRGGSATQPAARAGQGFVVAGLAVPPMPLAPTLPGPAHEPANSSSPAASAPARGMQVMTSAGPRLPARDPRVSPASGAPAASSALDRAVWLELDCQPWVGRVWHSGHGSLYGM